MRARSGIVQATVSQGAEQSFATGNNRPKSVITALQKLERLAAPNTVLRNREIRERRMGRAAGDPRPEFAGYSAQSGAGAASQGDCHRNRPGAPPEVGWAARGRHLLASRHARPVGVGFSLVWWKPAIGQRLGQQLAETVRGSRVSSKIGRQRGPSERWLSIL